MHLFLYGVLNISLKTANSAYDKYHNITHTNIKDYIGHFISDINTYKAYIKDDNIEYDFVIFYNYNTVKDSENVENVDI